jgi:hypothetical protein
MYGWVIGDGYPSPSPPGSYRWRFLAFGGEAASSRLRVVLVCRTPVAWGGCFVKKNFDRFHNSRCRFLQGATGLCEAPEAGVGVCVFMFYFNCADV